MREKIRRIIYEADTPLGKLFDVVLLCAIILSIFIVCVDSISDLHVKYGDWFFVWEVFITAVFSFEYALRVYSIDKASKYIFSFFGVVDLLAILPGMVSLFLFGAQPLILIRSLRLLRVFRILKLSHFMLESRILVSALMGAKNKIFVFFCTLASLITIFGALMYVVENGQPGFEDIFMSAYWAVVTMTTVGYGDIVPQSPLGKFIAAILMVAGYAIIAVPTGIMSVHIARASKDSHLMRVCKSCAREGHEEDAKFCKYCGGPML